MDAVPDKTTSQVTQEKPSTTLPDKWNYQTFKDYLLALSRGPEFRIPLDQMPKEINLSPEWHQILDKMRDETAVDMTERFVNIGFKGDRNGFVVPQDASRGLKGNVPTYVIKLASYKMKYKGKTEGIIGNIHSHPRLQEKRPLDRLSTTNSEGFSLGDLYTILFSGNTQQILGVVDGNQNIFAIKTKDSQETKATSQDKFVEAWYRRNGWKFRKRENMNDGERADRVSADAATIPELNKKIAKEYGLALYSGKKDKPLKRIYPARPTINPFASGK